MFYPDVGGWVCLFGSVSVCVCEMRCTVLLYCWGLDFGWFFVFLLVVRLVWWRGVVVVCVACQTGGGCGVCLGCCKCRVFEVGRWLCSSMGGCFGVRL